jgi:hypothetical protein
MACNTRNYWGFELGPSSGILKNHVSFRSCMLYHNFNCTFLLLYAVDKTWSQVIIQL